MSAKEKHAEDKRLAIVLAAQRLFAHFGLDKVTMDEIAAEVGLGKASLYYYFPTKESVFKAVIAREQQQFVGRMRPIVDGTLPSADKLALYVEQRVLYFQEFVNLNDLNLRSFLDAKPLFAELFRELGKEDLRMLTEILEEGIRRGEFAFPTIAPPAEALLHVLQGLGLRTLRDYHQEPSAQRRSETLYREVQVVTQLLIQGMTNNSKHEE